MKIMLSDLFRKAHGSLLSKRNRRKALLHMQPIVFSFFLFPPALFVPASAPDTHTHSHTHKNLIKLIKINKKERIKRTDHRLIRPTHQSTIGKSYFRWKTLTWRLKLPATHKFRNSPPLVVATIFFTNPPPPFATSQLSHTRG